MSNIARDSGTHYPANSSVSSSQLSLHRNDLISSTTLSSPADQQKDTFPFWQMLTLFAAPAFIFANMYSCQAILPILSNEFHIDAPTAGLTMSALVLTVACGSLIYGPLSDILGRKPVMVTSSFLVALPTLLAAFAPNFPTLVALRALQGLFMPGLTSVAIAYVNEAFHGRWRGLAMGIYFSGLVLGGLFARVGSAALASIYNWHIALFAFVLPTILAAIAMWKFLPGLPKPVQRSEGSLSHFLKDFLITTRKDMWAHLRNRRLLGAFTIGFTNFFGFIGAFTFLPYYLTGPAFHLPTISLSLVYLLWLTGVLSPVAGTLAVKLGSRRVIAVSLLASTFGLLLTLIPNLPIVILGLCFLTIGMFCTGPATNLFLGEQATRAKGAAASLYLALYYLGGSFGAILPGVFLNLAGWTGVVIICLITTIAALIADLILCR